MSWFGEKKRWLRLTDEEIAFARRAILDYAARRTMDPEEMDFSVPWTAEYIRMKIDALYPGRS